MAKDFCRETITDFIMANRDSAYRLAYNYVGNKEDALDIIQDSICKALSKWKSLSSSETLRSWYYRIVVNTALDFLRKRRRHLYLETDVLQAGILEAGAPGVTSDIYEDFDLRKAVNRLSTMNQTVIVLRFFEDLTLEEIASVMGENLSTIKTRLYSSLKKIRVEMEEPSDPGEMISSE